jgi:phage tail sheath protein FI
MTVDTATGLTQQVPPSVAVLGAYSQNDKLAYSWYAPAGVTRGALTTVQRSAVELSRDNLDTLYDAKINPLTDFPGTGVLVWGQKTLLATESALDRVNVRRLLIEIRRQVRAVANTILFEPNRESTLATFRSRVSPILQRVQEASGVVRYRVQIDTTTTTQADVENNTIRGKIYLQPTRTAEFVALDFVVTNAGAEI